MTTPPSPPGIRPIASSTDNALVRWDGTNGKVVQSSTSITIDDSGNVLLRAAAVGTNGTGTLALGNGTVPGSSPADMVQLFSVDLSADNATLGIRTETAVVGDIAVASTNSLTIKINGTSYKLLLGAA